MTLILLNCVVFEIKVGNNEQGSFIHLNLLRIN